MHAYEQTDDGIVPRHLVPMSSRPDELRPTRITDLRKWWKEGRIVQPSVTTVQNVLDKAALNNWKIDRHLEQVWLNLPRLNNQYSDTSIAERFFDFASEVKRLTELEMDKAPQAGTDIHKSLELYFAGELETHSPNYLLCENVHKQVVENTGNHFWKSETNFISDLGFGGQVDLHSTIFHEWVIDFKSKQTADKFKPGKMVYSDHSMQLAAYREGLGIPQARCANVFVCLETGEVDFHEHSDDQLETGWMMFYHALRLWQVMNAAPQ